MLLLLGLKFGLFLRESTWAPEWLGQMFQVGYNPDYPWLSLFLPGHGARLRSRSPRWPG